MDNIITPAIQRKLALDSKEGVFLTGECADRCAFFAKVENYPDGTALYFFYEFIPENYPAGGTGFFRWTREEFENRLYDIYGGWYVRHNIYGLKQNGDELWDGFSEVE
jgi:hypothetical protein